MREDFPFPLEERTNVAVTTHVDLLELIERLGVWLIEVKVGFATVYAPGINNFVQMMISRNGALYVESNRAGDLAERGEHGWTTKWEDHGGRTMTGEPGQERMAAEMLTRALVELHELQMPTTMAVYVSRQDAQASE